jgi:preprotein translocase SecE subunit
LLLADHEREPRVRGSLMARQTRAERRARREARERSGAAQRPRDGKPPVRPAVQSISGPAGRQVPGSGAKRFIGESIGELRKVEWPGQNQVIQGTVVVLIACLIIGSYLYLLDQVFNKFVSKVLLGQ